MSDDNMSEDKDKATPAATTGVTPSSEAGTEIKSGKVEMAAIESPPLAPEITPVIAPVNAPAIEPFVAPAMSGVKPEPEMATAAAKSDTVLSTDKLADFASLFTLPKVALPPLRMPKLTRRTRWRGLIAASMAFAAGVGASIGAIAVAPKNPPPGAVSRDPAAVAERDEMQKTIAKLNKEMSALKSNIESSAKATSAQLGKLSDKLKDGEKASESARRASVAPDTTGSIAPAVPVPTPRPVVAEAKPVVDGWNIRSARDGLVLVEGRGEIFEVVVGAPLPGLGRVEEIKRQNGQWVVVTPKGIIVAAARPRGYFERPYDRY
jgi:gas vesicle protein